MIAICSGYFNPLHEGHIEYFEEAWEYCRDKIDRTQDHDSHNTNFSTTLIVIVNNDEQTKIKNGIQFANANTRLIIVENLWMVDHAKFSTSDDQSVARDLYLLHKEYGSDDQLLFFNAGDRTHANPQEHYMCEQYGIEEVFLDMPKINSSSEILDKVGKEWYWRNVECCDPKREPVNYVKGHPWKKGGEYGG